MIRQIAFGTKKTFLKGGLHCHTTRSDGLMDPGDVIRLHKSYGYDFLALTDHRIYNYTDFAPEAGLTILPGMEFDSLITHENGFRCFHTVCSGLPDESNGFCQDQTFTTPMTPTPEDYQPYLDMIHENGNLTVYCHPEWSSTPPSLFGKLRGNFAMELWNSGCVIENDMDKDALYFDEMLGAGHRIWGIAVDDGHSKKHHGNGWVMVAADNDPKSILDALSNGAFYSTTGPDFLDFYVEDGIAKVKCSPVDRIKFHADKHPTRMICGNDLTEASLDLRGQYEYIRVSAEDAAGHRAWTNPIFLDGRSNG